MTKLVTGTDHHFYLSQLDSYSSLKASSPAAEGVGGAAPNLTVVWWILFISVGGLVLQLLSRSNWILQSEAAINSAHLNQHPANQEKQKIGLSFNSLPLTFASSSCMHPSHKFISVQAVA